MVKIYVHAAKCFRSFSAISFCVVWFLTAFFLFCNAAVAGMFPGKHSGKVVMEFDLSHYPSSKEVRLWLPYPVSDRWQKVDQISVKGNYDYEAILTEQKFKNPILFVRWNKGKVKRRLSFSFVVERLERREGQLPKEEPCWDRAFFKKYLAATSLAPVTGEVARLAHSITKDKKTIREKARAIYDWICDQMHRDPGVKGCGSGDVCLILDRRGGKCVDIHSVFVALARAAGVPAREVFGIRQGKDKVTDITKWYHCWGEFYEPGYGWVVVDPADVTKAMLVEGLSRDNPKIKRLREYFWGTVEPYRLRLSSGRDVMLNPRQHGKALNYFMYPFAQVGEKTLDWLDPKGFSYKVMWYPLADEERTR